MIHTVFMFILNIEFLYTMVFSFPEEPNHSFIVSKQTIRKVCSVAVIIEGPKHFLVLFSCWHTCYKGRDVSMHKHHAMKTQGGVEIKLHTFLTLALDGGEWPPLYSCNFIPGERATCIYCYTFSNFQSVLIVCCLQTF